MRRAFFRRDREIVDELLELDRNGHGGPPGGPPGGAPGGPVQMDTALEYSDPMIMCRAGFALGFEALDELICRALNHIHFDPGFLFKEGKGIGVKAGVLCGCGRGKGDGLVSPRKRGRNYQSQQHKKTLHKRWPLRKF